MWSRECYKNDIINAKFACTPPVDSPRELWPQKAVATVDSGADSGLLDTKWS